MSSLRPIVLSAFVGLVFLMGAASKSAASSPPHYSAIAPIPVLPASSVSWRGFVNYWRGFVKNSSRVVVIVGLVAAAALFIITRGKWMH
jgi:hypothetical protein